MLKKSLMSQKQKCQVLSLEEKHDTIDKCDKGQKNTAVDKEYEILQSSLLTIFKNQQ